MNLLELALSLHQSGELAEASRHYDALLKEVPENADALHLSGLLMHQAGESEAGLARIEQALQGDPGNSVYLYNRGVVLHESGVVDAAAAAYRKCLEVDVGNVSAWVNLGNLLADHGHFGEALDCHRNAAKLQPGEGEHLLRVARDLRLIGDIDGALALLGELLGRDPDNEAAWSAMLFASQYQTGISRAELFRRHSRWAARFPAAAGGGPRKSGDSLRVGFLSPDFGNHPVGIFLAPLLERLKRHSGITTVCFNERVRKDEYQVRIREAADEWHEVASLGDDSLEEQLKNSRLNVLIDLCGHGEGNRVRLFARKPVPVQMSWAGYTGTTGLRAIDYLLSDTLHTPVRSEEDYAERLLCFPCDYLPWEAPAYAPQPAPLPMLAKGYPTFGCFNNPSKLSAPTLSLWGHLLTTVPDSRLVLKYKGMQDPAVVTRVRGLLSVHGVAPDRIDFLGQTNHRDHLEAFSGVDVALDPMPYSGGLSTCEAIWMGVPVVTLPGDTFASRHSFSHLRNAGVGDTVAKDEEDYLRIASTLVADPKSLSKRRSMMRGTVAASPLLDLDAYTSDFLSALGAATGCSIGN